MRVKIGDTIYSPGDTPIIIQLTPDDKRDIAALPPQNDVWCVAPVDCPPAVRDAFMASMPPHPVPPAAPPAKLATFPRPGGTPPPAPTPQEDRPPH